MLLQQTSIEMARVAVLVEFNYEDLEVSRDISARVVFFLYTTRLCSCRSGTLCCASGKKE